MSTITVTTFKWVSPIVQGLVRDLRVRWALEEAGLAYIALGPAMGAASSGRPSCLSMSDIFRFNLHALLRAVVSGATVARHGMRDEALGRGPARRG
jgi:hypothetical protein